jgi:hypothetical protein
VDPADVTDRLAAHVAAVFDRAMERAPTFAP